MFHKHLLSFSLFVSVFTSSAMTVLIPMIGTPGYESFLESDSFAQGFPEPSDQAFYRIKHECCKRKLGPAGQIVPSTPDLKKVKKALECDAVTWSHDGESLLYFAIQFNRLNIVKLLLKHRLNSHKFVVTVEGNVEPVSDILLFDRNPLEIFVINNSEKDKGEMREYLEGILFQSSQLTQDETARKRLARFVIEGECAKNDPDIAKIEFILQHVDQIEFVRPFVWYDNLGCSSFQDKCTLIVNALDYGHANVAEMLLEAYRKALQDGKMKFVWTGSQCQGWNEVGTVFEGDENAPLNFRMSPANFLNENKEIDEFLEHELTPDDYFKSALRGNDFFALEWIIEQADEERKNDLIFAAMRFENNMKGEFNPTDMFNPELKKDSVVAYIQYKLDWLDCTHKGEIGVPLRTFYQEAEAKLRQIYGI